MKEALRALRGLAAASLSFVATPNLFQQMLGQSDAAVVRKIDAAWQQLFHGDPTTQRVAFDAPGGMAYVADIASRDVRTEGMSYGMMIAVQLDHRREFDALWRYALAHLYHPNGPFAGYFAWHCTFDGRQLDPGPASDGEEWFATALLFADGRWGSGHGEQDYGGWARRLLHTMRHHGEQGGEVGPMFNAAAREVVFVPQGPGSRFTDPSYHLPAFYRFWAQASGADRDFWLSVADRSRKLFREAANPRTGLMPDYCSFEGKPLSGIAGTRSHHDDFRYDAWRVMANVALDHTWFPGDSWEVEQSNRILGFIARQGPDCPDQYTLEGRPVSSTSSSGLYAMAAVGALAADPAIGRPLVERLWNAPVPDGTFRYYNGMLHLLALLEVSGHFRPYLSQ